MPPPDDAVSPRHQSQLVCVYERRRKTQKADAENKTWTGFMFTSKTGAFIQTIPKAAWLLERACKCLVVNSKEKTCLAAYGESGEFFSWYCLSVPAGCLLLCKAAL